MTNRPPLMRALGLTTALALLAACSTNTSDLDWDLRSRVGAVNTADAARQATAQRP
ncbi:peptidase M23, partial [Cereibacter changlensis]